VWRLAEEHLLATVTSWFNAIWFGRTTPPKDWKEGTIVTIYKLKGDPKLLENYRPITLLNGDYKWFGKVIAARLDRALNKLIGPAQQGFLKERLIHENILNMRAAFDASKSNKLKAVAGLIDFKSAFDSYERTPLRQAYEHIGCPRQQLEVMMELMEDTTVRVLVNGHLTKEIEVGRGSRQGCAVSPKHFVVIIEPMQRGVESLPGQIGIITAGGVELRVLLFADDLGLMAKDYDSFKLMLKVLSSFEHGTGLRINRKKCCIIPLGWDPPRGKWCFRLVRDEPEKYLGVMFNRHGPISMMAKKTTDAVTDMERWRNLHLSLLGRRTILNTYLLPRFLFESVTTEIPPADLSRLVQRMDDPICVIRDSRPFQGA
jgi:hypothetical protein